MRQLISLLGITFLLVILVLGCGKPEEPAQTPKPAAKPQTAPAKPAATKHAQEGTAKLLLYDDPDMPIRTEYPDIMKVEATGSGEGVGFIFAFKPQGNALDKAKVHIFLPRGAGTAAAQEPFVTGPQGLITNNGWKKEGDTTNIAEFPYGWVKKIIGFSDPANKGMVGKILLGEAGGQALQVILYYQSDMAKEYRANADIILGRLHFKSDKLPLGKPH